MGVFDAVIGGVSSYIGGERANANARQMQQESHNFSADMSSTSMQRRVQDLQAAGLNPMLAVTQGGASSPSGGAAPQADTIGPTAASAMAAGRYRQELSNLRAEERKTLAEARYAEEGRYPISRMIGDFQNILAKLGVPQSEQDEYLRGWLSSSARSSGNTAKRGEQPATRGGGLPWLFNRLFGD